PTIWYDILSPCTNALILRKGAHPMGVDITGWVEVEKSYEWERGTAWEWYGVVKIDHLVHRSYGMFGGLFGWYDGYGFKPVVGERGKPEHMSEEFFLECEGY